MTYVLTGRPEVDILLKEISSLDELALIEGRRYPGGGISFSERAERLREKVRALEKGVIIG